MRIFLCLIGIVASFFLIKKRESIGSMIGEAEWMAKVGGIYNVIVIVALFLFFWSLAELTNTTSVLFSPLKNLFPQFNQSAVQEDM